MKFQSTITNLVCVLCIFFPPPKVGHLCYQWLVSTGKTISADKLFLAAGRKEKNAHLKLYLHELIIACIVRVSNKFSHHLS